MSLLSRTVRVWVPRMILGLVLLLAVAYIVDYLQFQYRVHRNRQPYGTVTIQTVYAIAEKAPRGDQKTEYASGGSQDQTCANSLFPQSGYKPCWYLRRKVQQQINM